MALNIKNAEVESLAAEVAKLAHESKTEAIRIALQERAFRLKSYRGKLTRRERIDAALDRFWEQFPKADYGRRLSKEEEERILGFGPDGV
jgi:antitoxin VapB